MNIAKSGELFTKAQALIPGGVNSPVRAFRSVGGTPRFMARGDGAYVYDVDGNRYIDFLGSWGPLLLGHGFEPVREALHEAVESGLTFGAPTEREVLLAELICRMVPGVEKVRLVNSGTEATMAAVRLARGFTGRAKIVKFEGCYHGHADSFLIAAGSGALTFGSPNSPGVTAGTAQDTLLAAFNDLESAQRLFEANPGQIAALIIEPVAGNMGCIVPRPGFLQGLRRLCSEHGAILIFDEVMTGFRLARGGAQELFGVTPDLTTLGKIIGGGLPVGAYGGRADIMEMISPAGKVYQAGTLSGNPLATAAGLAMLNHLDSNPEVYARLEAMGARLEEGLGQACRDSDVPYHIERCGSMMTVFFSKTPVTNYQEAVKGCDTNCFGRFFLGMLDGGVYLAPSQFEAFFLSAALSGSDLDATLSVARRVLVEISSET